MMARQGPWAGRWAPAPWCHQDVANLRSLTTDALLVKVKDEGTQTLCMAVRLVVIWSTVTLIQNSHKCNLLSALFINVSTPDPIYSDVELDSGSVTLCDSATDRWWRLSPLTSRYQLPINNNSQKKIIVSPHQYFSQMNVPIATQFSPALEWLCLLWCLLISW